MTYPHQPFCGPPILREKNAATRYEKEIAAGNISRGDVTPGVPNLPGFLNPVSRKQTRGILSAPAEVDPATLERTRKLKGMQHAAQIGAAGQYVPEAVGHLTPAPGMYAGSMPTALGQIDVHAPLQSGQFMRTAGSGPIGLVRAQMSATQPHLADKVLSPTLPQDRTLGHAVAQHELGEAAELSRLKSPVGVRPYASHLGVEPILREQQALRGDPAAVHDMAAARSIHPDDKRMQGYIRRVGGTPDAPLAIGGRQQRAVERLLDRESSKILPEAKVKALNIRSAGGNVPYIPHNVPSHLDVGLNVLEAAKAPTLRGKLTKGLDAVKGYRRYASWIKPH